ncbi:heterochromatin protein 1-like [Culex quinquefasciatus]|uniref:heterochromatin protein 1-like n=1 Tax=Culex quinquefasciatus TaxID=7176 RepID=UPI0018E3F61D|nr:heterochromatin protein 1-like [Culex quinquefasciatus]XP_038118429.1 heterochromatin protein 1-like [Culex quinquefasciatus]
MHSDKFSLELKSTTGTNDGYDDDDGTKLKLSASKHDDDEESSLWTVNKPVQAPRLEIIRKIKWKGCEDSGNSWESEENLNCQDLLEKNAREEGEKWASSHGKRSSTDSYKDSYSNMNRAGEDVEKAPPKL